MLFAASFLASGTCSIPQQNLNVDCLTRFAIFALSQVVESVSKVFCLSFFQNRIEVINVIFENNPKIFQN